MKGFLKRWVLPSPLWLVVAAVIAMAAAGDSGAMVSSGGGWGMGGKLLPSEREYIGFPVQLHDDSRCNARVTDAHVIGADDGLTTGVVAVDRNEGSYHSTVGAMTEGELPVTPHPVTDALLTPDDAHQRWYLLGVVSARELGTYRAGGLHVDYICGQQSGSAEYGADISIDVVASR